MTDAIALCSKPAVEGAGLFIRPNAVAQLVKLRTQQPEGFLRLMVLGGGCSGFQYTIKLDAVVQDDDIVFSHENVRIIVDSTSYGVMQGSTVDYVDEMIGAQFVIQNPNAKTSCGCGNSFSII